MFGHIVGKVFYFVPAATLWGAGAALGVMDNFEYKKTHIRQGEKRANDTWFRRNVKYPDTLVTRTGTSFDHYEFGEKFKTDARTT